METLEKIALIFTIIGALNWGLIGLFDFNLVNFLFKDMEMLEIKGHGYLPAYTRTDLTDDLHSIFGLNTDTEIVTYKKMKEILNTIKTI